ncbi:MAG TPA: hypothetical protein VIQ99_08035 [Gammaproteobacteria bacterium]
MAVELALQNPARDESVADRWVYVLTAALFAAVAIVGFAPRSMAILAGELRFPPLIVHVHAALMVAWLGLLLAQTLLVAKDRTALHMKLGLASLVVAPCLWATMIAITIWRYDERAELGQIVQGSNILLTQARSIIYFALFFTWAFLVRKTDRETHKRMMLLATVGLMGAAITRMTWLPTTFPEGYGAVHAYMLLLLAPSLTYDIVRLGRPHRAYVIGLALFLPWLLLTQLLWGSPWWVETASKLMGVDAG